ncbi:MAG: hypothetical protein FJ143_13580 [Deltaproteobacteria bacterium]|nr:hypothetical protein [Deltaproteobacteria bacterium]MBM4298762.1 hypothetical protein [Deltaproteobacteria bacterium]
MSSPDFANAKIIDADGHVLDREAELHKFLFRHTVGRRFETLLDCVALIYGGIPEQFPRLRVVFLECGCGWVPYWMDRMDEEWEKRRSEAPLLKMRPSDYMKKGNWFYAAEPEESTLPFCLDKVGEDTILFASDYPHWDGSFPSYDVDGRGAQRYHGGAKSKEHAR